MTRIFTRRPVFCAGEYTVHKGQLDTDDPRGYWIEGPTLRGSRGAITTHFDRQEAIERCRELHLTNGWTEDRKERVVERTPASVFVVVDAFGRFRAASFDRKKLEKSAENVSDKTIVIEYQRKP